VQGADLAAEALFLARLIDTLKPGEPEVEGCLALILLTRARAVARVRDGVTVPPAQQDRRLWDEAMIAEGRAVLARAVARRVPDPFRIRAAMADCQMAPGGLDWPQIAGLAARLVDYEETPVTRLSAAVARAEAGDPAQGLAMIRALGPALAGYQPWHAALAEYLARAGDPEAPAAYDRALALTRNPADAALPAARRAALTSRASGSRVPAGSSESAGSSAAHTDRDAAAPDGASQDTAAPDGRTAVGG
jgi:RNA polymerase sigma-70 factor (ECF subfamily)